MNLLNIYIFFFHFVFTVTDVELKRLKDAFKRTSGLSAYMTQQCFYKEVLGDGVPPKVAEVKIQHAIAALSALTTKIDLLLSPHVHPSPSATFLVCHCSKCFVNTDNPSFLSHHAL